MTKQFFTKDYYKSNRKDLVKSLPLNSIVILFSAEQFPKNGDQYYKYRQNSNLYYFTGLTQEKTIIVLHKGHKNDIYDEYAFIIEADQKMLTWIGHKYSKEEASAISGIEKIEYLDSFGETMGKILSRGKTIYYSSRSNIRGIQYKNNIAEASINSLRKSFYNISIRDLEPFIVDLRLIKKEEEIQAIQTAIDITKTAFDNVLKFVKPNVYEYAVEAELSHSILSAGAQDFAYLPIVASGASSCVLHYCTNRNICKDGELLLMDFGAEQDYYAADVTRTIPVNGKFTPRQKEVYNSVLSVFKQMKVKMTPGTCINQLNTECETLIEQELLKLNLITQEDIANQTDEHPALKKYFMHGLSHFIGLDVHDVGKKDTKLLAGMVLSCEPGIYVAEEGFGIRLENDILVAEKPIDLCQNIPIEVDEIERLMKK